MKYPACPAFNELVAHAEQPGEVQKNRHLARHIRSCPDCRETLAVIRAFRPSGSDHTTSTTRCLTEQDLSAYLDHGLDPEAREKVERHLIECDSCLAEVGQAARAIAALETVTDSTPEWLVDRAQEMCRQPAEPRRAKQWVMDWGWKILVPACAVALFFVAFKFLPNRQLPPAKTAVPVAVVRKPDRPQSDPARTPVKPADAIADGTQSRDYKIAGRTEVVSGILAERDTIMTDELARVLTGYTTERTEKLTTILTRLGLRMDGAGITQVFVSRVLMDEIARGGREHPILLVLLDDGTLAITRYDQADELNQL